MKSLKAAVVGALAMGALVGFQQAPAQALNAPDWSASHYWTDGETAAYNAGCDLGNDAQHASGTQNYVSILAFGAFHNTSNGWKFGQFTSNSSAWITDTKAKQIAQEFAHGFWACSNGDTSSFVTIGIGGTNESSGDVTQPAGNNLAGVVNNANGYLASSSYSSQAHIVGAADIEPDWGSPGDARNLVDGYDNNNLSAFYNNGSADGCDPDNPQNEDSCGTANFPAWKMGDVWYVSYGVAPAYPLPQIYRTDANMAKQWATLSLFAYQQHNVPMNFIGSATQHRACAQTQPIWCANNGLDNTVDDGYTQLYNKLDQNTHTHQSQASLKATDWKWG